MSSYLTWYEFKKELERRAGCIVVNSDWLQLKPRLPLPWDEHCLQLTLLNLQRMKKRKNERESYIPINQALR